MSGQRLATRIRSVDDAPMTFADDGHAAIDWLARYQERLPEAPVLSRMKPGEIRAALPLSAPEQPEPFERVLEDLDTVLFPGLTHWQSPRFFAYFSTTGSDPGVLAELLMAGLNNVGILWRTSPALQELEETTLDWLAQLLGLPPGLYGRLEEGASFSTLTALAAAREARPGARTVVCSEHAHSSVDKACRLLELEVRKTPADEEFRLGLDALDLSNACAVVATVGTTSCTSVDPVGAIADACGREGVWLHVDAAYAGAAMICPEFRWAFDGVERADSLVVNPHKWLFVPQGCSALWTRRPEAFLDAFSLVPEYLRTPDAVVSFSEYGLELGRPFRALKLWAVMRCYGADGLRERVREAVRLASLFESWVGEEPGWELAAPRHFSVVCFRRDASDAENEEILRRVNERGRTFISHTRLNGRYVLRLAVGNERTTEDDVRLAWDELRSAGMT
jgi:aromatic-L-amino-acid/L-tryptophan decarboxylase